MLFTSAVLFIAANIPYDVDLNDHYILVFPCVLNILQVVVPIVVGFVCIM